MDPIDLDALSGLLLAAIDEGRRQRRCDFASRRPRFGDSNGSVPGQAETARLRAVDCSRSGSGLQIRILNFDPFRATVTRSNPALCWPK